MSKISIFYNGKLEIDLPNYDRIIHSIISLSDTVWLNANIVPEQTLPQEIQNHIKGVIDDLAQKKIIRFWGYPNNDKYNYSPDKIISLSDYNKIYFDINRHVLERKKIIQLLDLHYEDTYQFSLNPESTSKIIELRNEYWNISIAKLLDANRLLIDSSPIKFWLGASEFYRYSKIERPTIEKIFDNYDIPSLSFLDGENILDLYNSNYQFKKEIIKKSTDILMELQTDGKTSSEDFEEVYKNSLKNIDDLVDSFSLKSGIRDQTKNSVYAISGFFVPILSIIPLGDTLLSWLYKNKKFGFLTFVVKCRKKRMNVKHF